MAAPFDQADSLAGDDHLPDALPTDPMPLFKAWFDEAAAKKVQPNPNAMTVATVDPDGKIGARILLCKEVDVATGSIVFFTNYTGRKSVAIDAGSRAAVVFHWDVLDKQVRIEGPVVRVPGAESDAYFASRPWESRVGAWSSDQSKPVGSRAEMRAKVEAAMRKFGIDPARPPSGADAAKIVIPRPPHWGGYRVWAERMELWISGVGRVHDRAAWTRGLTRSGDGYRGGTWGATRLQP